MVYLRDAAITIRTKINTKINETINNFREPPSPSQYQTSSHQYPEGGRKRATTTSFSHSTSTPPPSNPPNNTINTNNSYEKGGERTPKEVVQSLYTTMFAACTGAQPESCSANGPQCPATSLMYCEGNYNDHHHRRQQSRDVLHTMQKRTRKPPSLPTTVIQHSPPPSSIRSPNHRKSKSSTNSSSKSKTNQQRRNKSHTNDDYNHANFYNEDDYHAQQQQQQQQTSSTPARHPVPSTQLSIPTRRHVTPSPKSLSVDQSTSSRRDSRKRRETTRRRLNVITPREAEENRIARSNNAATQAARGSNRQVRQEHINVGGMPYRLTECGRRVPSTSAGGLELEEEEEDGMYNYDDGISALSAHTLEDMAKRDLILDRQRGEEGFDIAQDGNDGGDDHHNLQGNPSMISSMEESLDREQERAADKNSTNMVTRSNPANQHEEQISKEDSIGPRRASYPVQMARNRSAVSNATGASSKQSSKSNFSDVWKRQEQQYWMQVVKEDGPVEFAVASKAAKKAALTTDEKKPKTTQSGRTSPQQQQQQQQQHQQQHPHETMHITARDVVPQKKKKKNRSKSIFGRRKGYVTYEEEEDIEYSPIRIMSGSSSYAEV